VRVYDAGTPVNHLLQEGVFKLESRGGDLRKAIDCDPVLGVYRIVIVHLESDRWTEVKGAARQYFNPSWSPDGRSIAAIADVNAFEQQPTYFGQRDSRTALSVFDVASGTERRLTVDAASVLGTPAWSPDSGQVLLLAERHPPSPSFTSILVQSLTLDRSTFVPTPRGLSARAVRWSRDGKKIVATLFDRFTDSLWKLNLDGGNPQQIQTLAWQVDSFAELDADVFLFNVQSGSFKSRLGTIDGTPRTFRLISGVSNAILLSAFPLPLNTGGIDQATKGNVFDDFQDYVKLSPIFKMRELDTAMLLMVGDQDWTWVPQMIAQYGVLRMEGKDVQLIRYANEGHNLSRRESIEDALRRMHRFFDERLLKPQVH
jgi:dipeptidyl aminopeptidase/acylaminoacyl peptidase